MIRDESDNTAVHSSNDRSRRQSRHVYCRNAAGKRYAVSSPTSQTLMLSIAWQCQLRNSLRMQHHAIFSLQSSPTSTSLTGASNSETQSQCHGTDLTYSRLFPMAYGVLLLGLAVFKAKEIWILNGFHGKRLVVVLIRDQVIYFFMSVILIGAASSEGVTGWH